jgi:hypothetical protein
LHTIDGVPAQFAKSHAWALAATTDDG